MTLATFQSHYTDEQWQLVMERKQFPAVQAALSEGDTARAREIVEKALQPALLPAHRNGVEGVKTSADWKTAPISPTCEVLTSGKPTFCGAPTSYAYPAMGRGWMALCHRHAQKHLKHGGAIHTDALILKGEKWE